MILLSLIILLCIFAVYALIIAAIIWIICAIFSLTFNWIPVIVITVIILILEFIIN